MAGTTTRKRTAESTPADSSAQRPSTRRRAETETINVETYRPGSQGEDGLRISIGLPIRFNVFPDDLRMHLQRAYITTIRSQLKALDNNTTLAKRYTFCLITELRIRSSSANSDITLTTLRQDIPAVSLANMALLENFYTNHEKCLEDPSFVPLVVTENIANPDFIQLHSVRRDEIGWGYDVNGCLSLYLVYIENGKLHEYAIYVQRKDAVVKQEG